MADLINVRALWAHALSECTAVYDPADPDAPIEVIRNGRVWLTLPPLPPELRGSTGALGVMLDGKGWLALHPKA
jgi:hypothetical protein